ncbi:MAG: RluA family pseudouridine synthase [Christensenella sp.]|nr:RluA family pseudouridine synthase [Christensenella sp.]
MTIPRILYEDNHLVVAIKPQNMPTQADSSKDADFLNQIKQYVKETYGKPGEAYIGLVHRLDRPAGGVMVFARTSKAAARLSAQIKNGSFQKKYFAVVSADLPISSELSDFLLKNAKNNTVQVVSANTPGAKHATLRYRTIEQNDDLRLLDISLLTGRPHQIRVQLAHAGAPLLGDVKYGGEQNSRLCLWSYQLSFLHPTKKERLTFDCPPPDCYPWNLFCKPISQNSPTEN